MQCPLSVCVSGQVPSGAGVGGSQRTHAGAEHMVEALLCPRGLLNLCFICNLIWSLTQVSRKLASVTGVYRPATQSNAVPLSAPKASDPNSGFASFPNNHQSSLELLHSILMLFRLCMSYQRPQKLLCSIHKFVQFFYKPSKTLELVMQYPQVCLALQQITKDHRNSYSVSPSLLPSL